MAAKVSNNKKVLLAVFIPLGVILITVTVAVGMYLMTIVYSSGDSEKEYTDAAKAILQLNPHIVTAEISHSSCGINCGTSVAKIAFDSNDDTEVSTGIDSTLKYLWMHSSATPRNVSVFVYVNNNPSAENTGVVNNKNVFGYDDAIDPVSIEKVARDLGYVNGDIYSDVTVARASFDNLLSVGQKTLEQHYGARK